MCVKRHVALTKLRVCRMAAELESRWRTENAFRLTAATSFDRILKGFMAMTCDDLRNG